MYCDQKRAKAGGRVGATGLMRAKSDEKCRIRPLKRVTARLGPPWPTFAHIDFLNKEAMKARNERTEENGVNRDTNLRHPCVRIYVGKITGFCAFFRDFSRFYALIRAVITRFYAFLQGRPIF